LIQNQTARDSTFAHASYVTMTTTAGGEALRNEMSNKFGKKTVG
jgi:hypothetical protein